MISETHARKILGASFTMSDEELRQCLFELSMIGRMAIENFLNSKSCERSVDEDN